MERSDRFSASLTEEGRYRLLLDAVTDYAIYMLDPDGIVTSWNSGARRFKGYTADEIIGQHFSVFYVEEDRRDGLPQRALETAAREGTFEREGWRVRKDGTRFWAHVVIDPIRDPIGGIIGFAKITRDLTERKRTDDALRQSERQFRLLVQGVADYAIYMLDPDGRVSSWNAGAQRIKGYRPEEIIGRHFSIFYTEPDREAGVPGRALETAAREGRYEKEGWRLRKDGTQFVANVVIDAIRDDDGSLIGFAKITRDVTLRREAERELEQARQALFHAQKMETIGRLTGGVAHDFNNILMAVLSGLELLRKRVPDDPKITGLLDNATQAAQRGASLTQRMLAFARRQELKPEPVDVPALVEGLSALLHPSLGPSVTIETSFPLGLEAVRVDANQFELALLNLVMNACHAMPDGGPIVIGARSEDVVAGRGGGLAAGRYICVSVTDVGEGMDSETLERAREPFFTTKGVGKGTGLGLSMVHGLAEQSGGQLVLKSRKAEGTTAELWLPVAGARPVDGPRQVRVDRSLARTRPLVVLVVDDDPIVLRNTAAMLDDLGHTVLEANSGREALDIFQHALAIDLVITDQAMPHLTGVQLIEAIHGIEPALPMILATGYAELDPDVGFDAPRLAKPFLQKELARCIADAIAHHEPIEGAPAMRRNG